VVVKNGRKLSGRSKHYDDNNNYFIITSSFNLFGGWLPNYWKEKIKREARLLLLLLISAQKSSANSIACRYNYSSQDGPGTVMLYC